MTITRALAVNPTIHLEVFLHKVDGITSDFRTGSLSVATDCRRGTRRQTTRRR
jgi:hypothetical protein